MIVAALGAVQAADGIATGDTSTKKIAFSNSFAGNSFRQVMVKSWEDVTAQAKKDGKIADAGVVSANGNVTEQAGQIQNMILQGYNAIVLLAGSDTALNGVVKDACDAGIVVVAVAGVVTEPCAYVVNYDWSSYGKQEIDFVAKKLGGKGNVLEIRGMAGDSTDKDISQGIHDAAKAYPDLKIVGSVYGQWTGTVAQKEVATILPSLPQVDAVVGQGGDGYGAAKAFEATDRKMPAIVMGNRQDELAWWKDQNKKNVYQTFSISATPSVSQVAFWVAQQILAGKKVPKFVEVPLLRIDADTVDAWLKATPEGGVSNPLYTQDLVVKMIDANANKTPLPAIPAPEYYSGIPDGFAFPGSGAKVREPSSGDLTGLRKSYGSVRALSGATFSVSSGEVVGLVGHNGAGKSTLINALLGLITVDEGKLEVAGRPAAADYNPTVAASLGIRCVHQELSLCPNLDLAENTRILHRKMSGIFWRRQASGVIGSALDAIFPGHGIPVDAKVGRRSIAERQMIEVARAYSEFGQRPRLVILDEPTSALGAETANQLLSHVLAAKSEGTSTILVTHRLEEIYQVSDRIIVMKDGAVIASGTKTDLPRTELMRLMGGIDDDDAAAVADAAPSRHARLSVAGQVTIEAAAGEIIGFAGLDGHGQREMLIRLYRQGQQNPALGGTSFVAGDRQADGVFPLWSIAQNLTIASLNAVIAGPLLSPQKETKLAEDWRTKIGIRSQKGRAFVWYSTEADEFKHCDRVYVFRDNEVVACLKRGEGLLHLFDRYMPVLMMVAMFLIIISMRPNVFSYFGINLLLKLSVPLVLAALSQMLIIALGDIDLSTGAFVGYVTCVVAVYLNTQPALVIALLAAGVVLYALAGLLIHIRQVPSIIVTLGMSFLWLGAALLILPTPGGAVPLWLATIPKTVMPVVPFPVWFAIGMALVVDLFLMRSSLGVILRGVGGNAKALQRAGWSVLRARVLVYALAGFFGVLSGVSLSALTTSGAPNIAPAYTLLSIASVILGGGSFVGGIISPVGTVVGALTLILVGSVLTFLNIPSVWQSGAQGLILIAVGKEPDMNRLSFSAIPSSAYGFIAAACLWLLTLWVSGGHGGIGTLTATLSFAIFAVIVGTGQMFVISSGAGNIDLSCPAVITLAAYVSMNLMAGHDSMLVPGLLAALSVGLVIGAVNFGLIRLFGIPPIIATLATSFIVMSVAMDAGGSSTIKPPEMLSQFSVWRIAGVQVIVAIAVIASLMGQVIITRSSFGRRLMAVGQNERAAMLAGIKTIRMRLFAYLISGVLSALTGFLLAGYTGGAALNMGDSYLMESVAVAVLGGTSVAGGKADALGVWGAALFLSLLTTLLNTSGVEAGWRYILMGAVIIGVIVIATRRGR
eukprot:gene16466-16645_t